MVRVEIWGDYAAFNRPELKVERYSYDFITPSAARNILQAIYWHPGFEWIIQKIYIMKPIQRMTITRNEQKDKASYKEMKSFCAGKCAAPKLNINQTQRSSNILKDVNYIIEAKFEITDYSKADENKVYAIFYERLKKGKCFSTPYLGVKEFPAYFAPVDNKAFIKPEDINKDCGLMLMDIDYSDGKFKPYYFDAKIEHGIVDIESSRIYK